MDGELDLTGLEPPEPLQRVLDALADLPPGEQLRVLLRREPFPLYSLLGPMGYEWSGDLRGDGDCFELLIREVPSGPDEGTPA